MKSGPSAAPAGRLLARGAPQKVLQGEDTGVDADPNRPPPPVQLVLVTGSCPGCLLWCGVRCWALGQVHPHSLHRDPEPGALLSPHLTDGDSEVQKAYRTGLSGDLPESDPARAQTENVCSELRTLYGRMGQRHKPLSLYDPLSSSSPWYLLKRNKNKPIYAKTCLQTYSNPTLETTEVAINW